VKFVEGTEERLAVSAHKADGAMTPHPARLAMGLGSHCIIETPQRLWQANPSSVIWTGLVKVRAAPFLCR